jgi:hypothetical protein
MQSCGISLTMTLATWVDRRHSAGHVLNSLVRPGESGGFAPGMRHSGTEEADRRGRLRFSYLGGFRFAGTMAYRVAGADHPQQLSGRSA